MKRAVFLLSGMFLVFGIVAITVSAQRGDRSIANIPHWLDSCPSICSPTPQPPPTRARPTQVPPTAPPPTANSPSNSDRDGDGITDSADSCPDTGGPAANNGCPLDQAYTPVSNIGILPTDSVLPPIRNVPALPLTGDCMLATRSLERVNVRANPSLQAEIVGLLDPQVLYPVVATLSNNEGLWDRIAEGWVARWVVRQGGSCASLPAVQRLDPQVNPGPPEDLLISTDFDFALTGEGQPPDPDKPDDCNRLGADWANRSSGQTIHVAFCDGSVHPTACDGSVHPTSCDGSVHPTFCDGSVVPTPTQWCVQPSADGRGFVIDGSLIAPPEPENQLFSIKWYAGIGSDTSDFPGETMVIAIIQPPNGGAPIMLLWHNPDADAPEGGNTAFTRKVIGVHVDPEAGAISIDWWLIAPPEPDAQADWNVHPQRTQGVIVQLGSNLDAPPDPNAQRMTITLFPDGTGPGAQGLILDDTPGNEQNQNSGYRVKVRFPWQV